MGQLTIYVAVDDDKMAIFNGRDLMVTPLSVAEQESLARGLASIANTLGVVRKSQATLGEATEDWAVLAPEVRNTIGMLPEPLRLAAEQLKSIRVMLGRSALVGWQYPIQERVH